MTLKIIAGERRGAILATPKGLETRPTLGRVRGSLFMILMPWLEDARVLDVFAGSGALALESLSRGASHATLIESARPALDAIQANLAKLHFQDRARVITRDALACLPEAAPAGKEPYDIIFLDPPYNEGICHKALERLARHGRAWLAPGGIIAAQHGRDDTVNETYGDFHRIRHKDYGETKISFYQFPVEEEQGTAE